MDDAIRSRLHVLAVCSVAFAEAHGRRNPDYDWLTPDESVALANLRAAVADLAREEAKRRKRRVA